MYKVLSLFPFRTSCRDSGVSQVGSGKESTCQWCRETQETCGLDPWVQKILEEEMTTYSSFLPENCMERELRAIVHVVAKTRT